VTAVPDLIELPAVGAQLRRYRLGDSDALFAAVEESRDHLRPHMPWADEARPDFEAFVAEAVAQWSTGSDRNYVIVDAVTGELLGGCGLHARIGPDGLEIGYWLRAGATGRGIVTVAARALTDAAMAVDGVSRVEIHCDEANLRSAAVARRLGYRLDRIEPDLVSAPGDLGRSMIWVWTVGLDAEAAARHSGPCTASPMPPPPSARSDGSATTSPRSPSA
jgi:RimJ/RimL family protein N-acetyltransferase